jgi:hypothetical protein
MDVDTESATAQSPSDLREIGREQHLGGLAALCYGLVAGPITAALGAVVSVRMTGSTRVVVWVSATALLAIGAIYLAEPGMLMIRRCLRSSQFPRRR